MENSEEEDIEFIQNFKEACLRFWELFGIHKKLGLLLEITESHEFKVLSNYNYELYLFNLAKKHNIFLEIPKS